MSTTDAALAGYKLLKIEPYTPNIGATILDVNLANIGNEALRSELRKALAEFQVLFFRKQTLTPEQQIEIAKVFGDPDKAKAFFPRLENYKVVEVIETKPAGHRYGVDQWHVDISFSANPPTGTVLYSQVIPPAGGDTLWASSTAVFESLPKSLQLYLEELEAVHSFEHSGWPGYFDQLENGDELYRKARADHLPVVHPVVRTHPVTGKKLIYVNPNFTDRIKGLSRQQSDALLAFLFAQFQRPEFQARLRWEKNTVAIWDNRATVHYATNDYDSQHRLLHRVTFGEDQAF